MPLVFGLPWLLLCLAGLPALWWLLRVTPPPLKRITFPAVRLLHGLRDSEDKPHRIPPWLLALRMLAATCLIVAMAGPRFEPEPLLVGEGPLLLAVDNGWSAAPVWPLLRDEWESLVRAAERQGRGVQLLMTAREPSPLDPENTEDTENTEDRGPVGPSALIPPPPLLTASEALRRLGALEPLPYPSDYEYATKRLSAGLARNTTEAVFVSDGLGGEAARRFMSGLRRVGTASVRRPPPEARAQLLLPPLLQAENLRLTVVQAKGRGAKAGEARETEAETPKAAIAQETASVLLRDESGEVLLSEPIGPFKDGLAEATLRLPRTLLDRLASVALDQSESAGAVQLLAEGDRLRRVLLWLPAAEGSEPQPLLSSSHYLTQAFSLFAEVRRGKSEQLESFAPDLIVTEGKNPLPEKEIKVLREWMEKGGVLLRFAGEGLLREGRQKQGQNAQNTPDKMVPVRLRPALRSLGGTLSWEEPVRISADLPASSPLIGLATPSDLRVSRAVLAEPGPELEQRAWLWLEDGSPLVTAAERGNGVLVLMHTAANPEWSNIPISGYFVRLLRRIAELARLSANPVVTGEGMLEPLLTLNGFGQLTSPDHEKIRNIPLKKLEILVPGPRHPPGLYGEEKSAFALNLGGRIPIPADSAPPYAVRAHTLGTQTSHDLRPWLLTLAFLLALSEFWAGLALRGLLGLPAQALRQTPLSQWLPARNYRQIQEQSTSKLLLLICALGLSAGGVGALLALSPDPASAQEGLATNIQETRIVYAITGVRETDETSFAALRALTQVTAARTSVHLAEPFGVRPGRDDLSPYPLLYWPYDASAAPPDAAAREALHGYIARGGMVLLDLRRPPFSLAEGDAASSASDGAFGAGGTAFLQALRLPPLGPAPRDYVLYRSFYLLSRTSGRYDSPSLWISAPDPAADDVAPLVVGANDWAAAWALDGRGQPLYALIPGGEEQREHAYRFGINLILHALSGSYKADQIHLKAIIDRLQR